MVDDIFGMNDWFTKGCSFTNTTFNDQLLGEETRPVILGDPRNCNIAFPGWMTTTDRRNWRMMMDMPGAEWDPKTGSNSLSSLTNRLDPR